MTIEEENESRWGLRCQQEMAHGAMETDKVIRDCLPLAGLPQSSQNKRARSPTSYWDDARKMAIVD